MDTILAEDEKYMKEALIEADKAGERLEVPIGAVVVCDGKIVGRGFNRREGLKDPLAHAELLAIKEASESLGSWRLEDCTLYVTIEPCPMCAGALINSRMARLVFGARDPKSGACGSVINLVESDSFNHSLELETGVLEEECSLRMREFFKYLRLSKKKNK